MAEPLPAAAKPPKEGGAERHRWREVPQRVEREREGACTAKKVNHGVGEERSEAPETVSRLGNSEIGLDAWTCLAVCPVGDGTERRAGCGWKVGDEGAYSPEGELLGRDDTGEDQRLPCIYPILNMRSGVSIQRLIDVIL